MKKKKIIGICSGLGVATTLIATTATLTSCSTITSNTAAALDPNKPSQETGTFTIDRDLSEKIFKTVENYVISNENDFRPGQTYEALNLQNQLNALPGFEGKVDSIALIISNDKPAIANIAIYTNTALSMTNSFDQRMGVTPENNNLIMIEGIQTSINKPTEKLILQPSDVTNIVTKIAGQLTLLQNVEGIQVTQENIKNLLNLIPNIEGTVKSVTIQDIREPLTGDKKTAQVLITFNKDTTYVNDSQLLPVPNSTNQLITVDYPTGILTQPVTSRIAIDSSTAKQMAQIMDGLLANLTSNNINISSLATDIAIQLNTIGSLYGSVNNVELSLSNDQPKKAEVKIFFSKPIEVVGNNIVKYFTDKIVTYSVDTKINPIISSNDIAITQQIAVDMNDKIQPILDNLASSNLADVQKAQNDIVAQLNLISDIRGKVASANIDLTNDYPKKAVVTLNFTNNVYTLNTNLFAKVNTSNTEIKATFVTRLDPTPPDPNANILLINDTVASSVYDILEANLSKITNLDNQANIATTIQKQINAIPDLTDHITNVKLSFTDERPKKANVEMVFNKEVKLVNTDKLIYTQSNVLNATIQTQVNPLPEIIEITNDLATTMNDKIEQLVSKFTDPNKLTQLSDAIKVQLNSIQGLNNKIASVAATLTQDSPAKVVIAINFTNEVVTINSPIFTSTSDPKQLSISKQTTINPPAPKVYINQQDAETMRNTIQGIIDTQFENESAIDLLQGAIQTALSDNVPAVKNKIASVKVTLTTNDSPRKALVEITFNGNVTLIDSYGWSTTSATTINGSFDTKIDEYLKIDQTVIDNVSAMTITELAGRVSTPDEKEIQRMQDSLTKQYNGDPVLKDKVKGVLITFDDSIPKIATVSATLKQPFQLINVNDVNISQDNLTFIKKYKTTINDKLIINEQTASAMYKVLYDNLSSLTSFPKDPAKLNEQITQQLNMIPPLQKQVGSVEITLTGQDQQSAAVKINFNRAVLLKNTSNFNLENTSNDLAITTSVLTNINKVRTINQNDAKSIKNIIDQFLLNAKQEPLVEKIQEKLNTIPALSGILDTVKVEYDNSTPKVATVTINTNYTVKLQAQDIFTQVTDTQFKVDVQTAINPKCVIDNQIAQKIISVLNKYSLSLEAQPQGSDIAKIKSEINTIPEFANLENPVVSISYDWTPGTPAVIDWKIKLTRDFELLNQTGLNIITGDPLSFSYSSVTLAGAVTTLTATTLNQIKKVLDDEIANRTIPVNNDLAARIKDLLNNLTIENNRTKVTNVVLSEITNSKPYKVTAKITFNQKIALQDNSNFSLLNENTIEITLDSSIFKPINITLDMAQNLKAEIEKLIQTCTQTTLAKQTADKIKQKINTMPGTQNAVKDAVLTFTAGKPLKYNLELTFNVPVNIVDNNIFTSVVSPNHDKIAIIGDSVIDTVLIIDKSLAASMKAQMDPYLNGLNNNTDYSYNTITNELLNRLNTIPTIKNLIDSITVTNLGTTNPWSATIAIKFKKFIQTVDNAVFTVIDDKTVQYTTTTNINPPITIDNITAKSLVQLFKTELDNVNQLLDQNQLNAIQTKLKDNINKIPSIRNQVLKVDIILDNAEPINYHVNVTFSQQQPVQLIDTDLLTKSDTYSIMYSGTTQINAPVHLSYAEAETIKQIINKHYNPIYKESDANVIAQDVLNEIKLNKDLVGIRDNIVAVTAKYDGAEFQQKALVKITFDKKVVSDVQNILEQIDSYNFQYIADTNYPNLTDGVFLYYDDTYSRIIGVRDGYENMDRYVLPPSVTEIDDGAFDKIKYAQYFDLSSSHITNLKTGTFKNCASMTDLLLPDSLNHLDTNALTGLTSIEYMRIPSGLSSTYLKDAKGTANYYVAHNTNGALRDSADYANEAMVIVPKECKTIGDLSYQNANYGNNYVFLNNYSVKSISFQEGIGSVNLGYYVFNTMSVLNRAIWPRIGAMSSDVFLDLPSMTEMTSVDNWASLGQVRSNCFTGLSSVNELDFSASRLYFEPTSINAISYNPNLSKLYLPDTLEMFLGRNFNHLENLHDFPMPRNFNWESWNNNPNTHLNGLYLNANGVGGESDGYSFYNTPVYLDLWWKYKPGQITDWPSTAIGNLYINDQTARQTAIIWVDDRWIGYGAGIGYPMGEQDDANTKAGLQDFWKLVQIQGMRRESSWGKMGFSNLLRYNGTIDGSKMTVPYWNKNGGAINGPNYWANHAGMMQRSWVWCYAMGFILPEKMWSYNMTIPDGTFDHCNRLQRLYVATGNAQSTTAWEESPSQWQSSWGYMSRWLDSSNTAMRNWNQVYNARSNFKSCVNLAGSWTDSVDNRYKLNKDMYLSYSNVTASLNTINNLFDNNEATYFQPQMTSNELILDFTFPDKVPFNFIQVIKQDNLINNGPYKKVVVSVMDNSGKFQEVLNYQVAYENNWPNWSYVFNKPYYTNKIRLKFQECQTNSIILNELKLSYFQ